MFSTVLFKNIYVPVPLMALCFWKADPGWRIYLDQRLIYEKRDARGQMKVKRCEAPGFEKMAAILLNLSAWFTPGIYPQTEINRLCGMDRNKIENLKEKRKQTSMGKLK